MSSNEVYGLLLSFATLDYYDKPRYVEDASVWLYSSKKKEKTAKIGYGNTLSMLEKYTHGSVSSKVELSSIVWDAE